MSYKITENIIDGLKKAVVELEEFQLQFALGKAEASEKFEEVKSLFNKTVHELSLKLDKGIDKADEIKANLEALHVQLTLGKAETVEAFLEQKAKIIKAIQEIENAIKTSKISTEYVPKIKEEIEKFKIKLDILYAQYEIEDKKKSFLKAVDDLKDKFTKEDSSWDHFTSEMETAFTHFKKAFNK